MSEGAIRKHATTMLVAAVTAAVTGGGAAIAATVADFAHNSDKIDGFHAVSAGNTARAGKLIATDAGGKLPAGALPPVNADRVDGFHAAGHSSTAKAGKLVATDPTGRFPTSVIPKDATPFSRYVVVRSDAGSAAANATRLQSRIDSLASTATAAAPYVVMVEPGTYAFGATGLTMKPFVDVVGAGVDRTVFTSPGGTSATSAAVVAASDSALRHVSIDVQAASAASSPYLTGIRFAAVGGATEVSDVGISAAYLSPQADAGTMYGFANLGHRATLRNVTFDLANAGLTSAVIHNTGMLQVESSRGWANGPGGLNYGIKQDGQASAYMTYTAVTVVDSSFEAFNGDINWGMKSYNAYGTLLRSTLGGQIGLESHTAADVSERFDVQDSTLKGTVSTIVLYPRNSARVWRGSQLDGGPANNFGGATGTVSCAGVYDENRVFHASSCP